MNKIDQPFIKTIPMNKFFQFDWQPVGVTVAAFLCSFIEKIGVFLLLVVALSFADLITGMYSAKVNKEPVKHPRGLERTLYKILMYWILIICTNFMVGTFSVPSMDLSPLNYMVTILVAYAEYQSVVNHVEKATGAKVWNHIKDQFTFLKNLTKKK